jgi:hypothetical protein
MRTHLTPFRRLATVAVLALLATTATACGGDDEDSGDSGSGDATVTQEQVDAAALTLENFTGEDWEEVPFEEGEDDGPGCFGEISATVDELEPDLEADHTFEDNTISLPSVDSSVSSFDDEDAITAKFDEVQELLATCTTIAETADDGTVYDLTLTTDEEALAGADDQINLVLTGTITPAGGEETNISQHATMIRVGNVISQVSTVDFGDESVMHAALAQIAVDRLTAALAGEEPPAAAAPEPA